MNIKRLKYLYNHADKFESTWIPWSACVARIVFFILLMFVNIFGTLWQGTNAAGSEYAMVTAYSAIIMIGTIDEKFFENMSSRNQLKMKFLNADSRLLVTRTLNIQPDLLYGSLKVKDQPAVKISCRQKGGFILMVLLQ